MGANIFIFWCTIKGGAHLHGQVACCLTALLSTASETVPHLIGILRDSQSNDMNLLSYPQHQHLSGDLVYNLSLKDHQLVAALQLVPIYCFDPSILSVLLFHICWSTQLSTFLASTTLFTWTTPANSGPDSGHLFVFDDCTSGISSHER